MREVEEEGVELAEVDGGEAYAMGEEGLREGEGMGPEREKEEGKHEEAKEEEELEEIEGAETEEREGDEVAEEAAKAAKDNDEAARGWFCT